MPRLDYVPRLDERNKNYRVTANTDLLKTPRYWMPGMRVLDQGREGACVGFGCTGEYMASPVRGRADNGIALEVYNRAKQIDEWEGVDYDGTSVRAGMLVGREKGWWTGFRWAFNMTELRAALEDGPVVIGIDWYDSMYEPVSNVVTVSGSIAGGHCILVTGFSAHSQSYRLRNSWGMSWGRNGSAFISSDDLHRVLFAAGGEAAVALGRAS